MRDLDIRCELRSKVLSAHSESDALILDELGICQGIARVDMAVVNGSVHGYEIKSECDTLARLPLQASVYSQALDFVTIVTAHTHLEKVRGIVPRWWGIWEAVRRGENLKLKQLRKAQRNPGLNATAVVQFLWRDEAMKILVEHGLAFGLSGKGRKHLWKRLYESFTIDELRSFVRSSLKCRGARWRAHALLTSSDD